MKANEVSFGVAKTQFVSFFLRKRQLNGDSKIKLKGNKLEETDSTKYFRK